jgi:tetratricopeptide (TPR) repeat protein
MDTTALQDVKRELAIAYSRDGPDGAAEALPFLEAALLAHPDDIPALQAKGVALGWLDRAEEGLATFEIALSKDPNREFVLKEAAQNATLAGKPATAIAYWQRAIAINPWRSDYRAGLAQLHVEAHNWPEAVIACRETLRLNPANRQVRQWLLQSYLNLGQQDAAKAEMGIIENFDSPRESDVFR